MAAQKPNQPAPSPNPGQIPTGNPGTRDNSPKPRGDVTSLGQR